MSLLALDLKKTFYDGARVMVLSCYEDLLRGDSSGYENIPRTGPFIIAANHLSFIDPPVIGAFIPRPIHYFARDTLFKPGLTNWLLTTLNGIPYKRGSDSDIGAMKYILKLLKEGAGLLLFLEGTRSLTGELQPPKPGLGMLACKTGVPIIPTRIFGSNDALNRANTGVNLQARISLVFGTTLYPKDYDLGATAANRYQQASNTVFNALSALSPIQPPAI